MSGPQLESSSSIEPMDSPTGLYWTDDNTKLQTQGETASDTGRTSNSTDPIGTDDGTSVQVAVRVRPMLPHERQNGATECVDVYHTADFINAVGNPNGSNVIQLGGESGPKFTFDQVFAADTLQSQLYEDRVAPLVASCLEGYNATVLAYGQTGSGKTHTIMGPSTSMTTAMLSEEEREQAGVIPRAIRSIFHQLQGLEASHHQMEENTKRNDEVLSPSYEYEVRIQFLEVYGEDIRDLLNPQPGSGVSKLSIRDVGNEEPEVVGATEHKVESAEEALLCLTRGMYRRVTGSTAMNETSSRSHAILSVIVDQSSILKDDVPTNSSDSSEGEENQTLQLQEHVQRKKSKFNFVDLAGSERQKRTQATGQRLKEGIDINKGLLVLGNVISALGDPKKQGKTFVPYRDSKLTRLLKGSLGGNHKTLMIACVSPSSTNLEESLNCLRYANRAKNIHNHAVVNVDATSALVADLRVKVQRLALDLMRARTGKISECSIPMTVIESLAKDAEGSERDLGLTLTPRPAISLSSRTRLPMTLPHDEMEPYQKHIEPWLGPSTPSVPEIKKLRAENDALRVQLNALSDGSDSMDALQKAYVAKATEYEMQISQLRQAFRRELEGRRGRVIDRGSADSPSPDERAESPELSRLKSQVFGSLSKFSTVDAEVEAEERSVKVLSVKYLSLDKDIDEVEEIDIDHKIEPNRDNNNQLDDDASLLLEADLFALSSSISAKEELIIQLQTSQEKYESMREFYEQKLKEMEVILAEKIAETEKLSEELEKLGVGHFKGKELSEKLKQKQAQVLELKRKQAELTKLTTVASRNDSQISRLRNEVHDMKAKKADLQKQISSERKTHRAEVQHLKKETLQKDRELSKVKRENVKKSQEASKAQQMAKSRLEQINQLKSKYKETEKRLRMQTIKRGVLAKAGLNPVMVGRRQSTGSKLTTPSKPAVDIDRIRDLFDQKVADVSRREHLAMKVAQEWEEHFDLVTQKEILERSNASEESIHALESQIKYREDRIRSIASRLGKREIFSESTSEKDDDMFLFDESFERVVGHVSPSTATRTAANVLFGMVVRERRRIASLARTASQLDEKVQEAEATAAAKDAAFRAYVDEQMLEAASLARNQQEHILSLMEMVKEDAVTETTKGQSNLSEKGSSKLLVLANERIAVLEQQLHETSLSREAVKKHRDREEAARVLLEDKKKECEDLEVEIDELRSTLRHIREAITSIETDKSDEDRSLYGSILNMVTETLHPSSTSVGSASRRRRSSTPLRLGESPSLTPKIKRDMNFMHSSDSEEMPDWADDIMADLAIIAEGKIPAVLLNSQEVIDAENQLNGNVFDRLNNPESFTGVQKQRTVHPPRSVKTKASSRPEGAKKRELTAQVVAESLAKAPPSRERTKKKEFSNRKTKEKRSSNQDAERRSVFDRLLSPSNLTGTQKQKFHDNKGRNLEKAIENQYVSTRGGKPKTSDCENEIDPSDEQETADMLEELLVADTHSSPVGERQLESRRTHENVFERLNKTTTAAYAVKQNTNIAEKMLDDLLHSSDSNPEEDFNQKSELKFERLEEYKKQDVFERLQRTTTEAYAQKMNSSVASDDQHSRAPGASPVERNPHPSSSPSSNKRITRSQNRSM